jgi:SNF2 family DNA or RNA helicase
MEMDNYPWKTEPYDFQREVWERSKDLEGFALWHEMGCGKTKIAIDTASWLWLNEKIDALLVIAPNTIHANWSNREIPTHMPDEVFSRARVMTWYSVKAKNKKTQRDLEGLLEHRGLAVLVATYDSMMTEAGSKAIKRFLQDRKCMYVLDESGRIKTPGAKRSKRIIASSSYAPYRRVLSGTPVDNNPLDVYNQVKFIRPDVWLDRGLSNFAVFKQEYGIWERRRTGAGQQFDALLRYRNLEDLYQVLRDTGDRRLKSEVLDLPSKIYTSVEFELDPKQAKMVKDMKKDYYAWLDDQALVTVDLALVRLLRIQQASCGYIKDDMGNQHRVGKNNRLKALKEVLEDNDAPTIIWARFSWDVDEIRSYLGSRAVYFDGRTSDEEREEAITSFQHDGSVNYFVAKASAAGEGLTLHRAKQVVYYSNSFSLRERLQSEDRAHRAGMSKQPVTYVDLVGKGGVDDYIITALRRKIDLADIVTGDRRDLEL